MKIKLTLAAVLTTGALLAALALPALADNVPVNYKAYGTGGTDMVGTGTPTNCWAIIPENGAQSMPVVTYLNVTTDTNTQVQFYTLGSPVNLNFINTSTNCPIASTNGFAVGDAVVLRHIADGTYEKKYIFSVPSATNIVLTPSPPSSSTAVGDMFYKATASGFIPVNATSKELTGGYIYAGQFGKPLLLDLPGGTNSQINAVGVVFP